MPNEVAAARGRLLAARNQMGERMRELHYNEALTDEAVARVAREVAESYKVSWKDVVGDG